MKNLCISTFAFFVTIFLGFVFPQSVHAQITVEHFDTHTTGSNGLLGNVIKDVIVADDGTIWGVAGDEAQDMGYANYTLFSLKNGEWKIYEELYNVRAVFQDSQGRIWAVGSYTWSYENGIWTKAYFENGDEVGGINCIYEDVFNNIWLGGGNYFYKYDKEKWYKEYLGSKQGGTLTYSIIRDKRGDVFFGKENKIFKWDGNDRHVELYEHDVFCLTEDISGNIYAGSSGGVHLYDGIDWSFFEYGGFEEDDFQGVRDIVMDEENNMWIANSQGLYQIMEGETSILEEPNEDYTIYKLELKDNILYLATSKGLRQYDMESETWSAITADGLTNSEIESFLQVGENTYIGTKEGCWKYGNGEWEAFLEGGRFDKMLMDEEGNMWMIDYNLLYKYDGETLQPFQPTEGLFPDGSNEVRDFLIDHAGILWITGGTFVSKYVGGEWVVMDDDLPISPYAPSPSVASEVLFEDSQLRIWVGGYNAIQYFDGDSIVIFDKSAFGESVFGEYIGNRTSIIEDNEGNIWTKVGSRIFKFDGQTWVNYDSNDGFISGTAVHDLTLDKNGNLWIATNWGISKYDGQNFTNYTANNGLSGYYDFTTISVDYLNRIWAGTRYNGIDVITDEITDIEVISETSITIYPNPTNNFISLQSKDSNPLEKVSLLDLQGKELAAYKNIKQINFQLDLSDYPSGLYFLKVETLKGSLVKRLIVD